MIPAAWMIWSRALSSAVVNEARSGSISGRSRMASVIAVRSTWYTLSSAQTSWMTPAGYRLRSARPPMIVDFSSQYAVSISHLSW